MFERQARVSSLSPRDSMCLGSPAESARAWLRAVWLGLHSGHSDDYGRSLQAGARRRLADGQRAIPL
jgi:hypothetical protein